MGKRLDDLLLVLGLEIGECFLDEPVHFLLLELRVAEKLRAGEAFDGQELRQPLGGLRNRKDRRPSASRGG